MFGGVEWERGNVVRKDRISDETAGSMCEQADHKEKCKVMGIPKCFKTLLPDLEVSGGVHEQEYQEHKMAGDTTRLCIVNLQSGLLPNLGPFNIEKIDVVSSSVNDCIEEHLVSDLAVKPDVFIGRKQPSQFWADDSNKVAEHWD